MTNSPLDRRRFLLAGSAVTAGAALAGPFGALGTNIAGASTGRSAGRGKPSLDGGYGELVPVKDQTTGLELLKLPRGFEYLSFGWTGETMTDGNITPNMHDGMAAFKQQGRIHLVRNHERNRGTPFADPNMTYDAAAGGGTTNLVFHQGRGELVESYASLTGTIRNCAGGPTPSNTWLSCEETTDIIDGVRHGYVFEVPATGVADPTPIKDMGRFSHEATATDPRTGIVYETEDTGSSGLYRYVPTDPVNLAAGGELQALALEGDFAGDTRDWDTGHSARATWVTVDNPDWGPGEQSCWQQARAKGAARISRGEGAWYGNDVIYVVSTDGGPARQGQIFAYDPATDEVTCVFASPSAEVLNAPDNICVSPRGGIVLCEDGSGREYLHGLTPDGAIFRFAENNVVLPDSGVNGFYGDWTGSEWAGATFDPTAGKWLFVNLQSPGITFAITGPWQQGAL